MPASVTIQSNFKKLEQLNKNAKVKMFAKVGILGDDANRTDDETGVTNAEIGLVHEMGSKTQNIPRRSFLEDPLIIKKDEINKTAGKLIAENLTKPNGMNKIFKQIGIKAEAIIQEAFASGGFGTWAELDEQTIKRKGSSSKLIDKGELRKSISSGVEKI